MTIDEMISVLQAAKDGKKIECRHKFASETSWSGRIDCWQWNFRDHDYRVKPEPREWWIISDPKSVFSTAATNHDSAENFRSGFAHGDIIHVREVLDV